MYNHPNKIQARNESIFKAFLAKTGLSKLPEDRQYWSLSANCSGTSKEHSDIDHPVRLGLITPNQYHGVDIQTKIIKANKKAWPTAHWYNMDFLNAMLLAGLTFRPGVVNFDTLQIPSTAVPSFLDILRYISDKSDGFTMAVLNVITKNPYSPNKYTDKDVTDAVGKDKRWSRLQRDWTMEQWCYWYPGKDNKSRTEMTTFVFFKGIIK